MAFTFNWAGIKAPVIQGGSRDYQQTIRADAANAGNAVRGYEQKKANWDYAHMLQSYDNPDVSGRVMELKAELVRLQQRNEEIKAQLGG
jgi:hypothetical protein